MTDYQWPTASKRDIKPFRRRKLNFQLAGKLKREIEAFYEDLLGIQAVVTPSGRSALSLILKHLKIARRHTIFAPLWSSACIWSTIGQYGCPATSFEQHLDVVVAVHKWGYVKKLSQPHSATLVEDSVDSLFTNTSTLFPNDGKYEVVSLPKTQGSYMGGLILVKEKPVAVELRNLIDHDGDLGASQAQLRYWEDVNADGRPESDFRNFNDAESRNNSLDLNSLENILATLKNHERNRITIERRLDLLAKDRHFKKYVRHQPGRLPSVLTVPVLDLKPEIPPQLILRQNNDSPHLDRPRYANACLLPLHFGVTERLFSKLREMVVSRLVRERFYR